MHLESCVIGRQTFTIVTGCNRNLNVLWALRQTTTEFHQMSGDCENWAAWVGGFYLAIGSFGTDCPAAMITRVKPLIGDMAVTTRSYNLDCTQTLGYVSGHPQEVPSARDFRKILIGTSPLKVPAEMDLEATHNLADHLGLLHSTGTVMDIQLIPDDPDPQLLELMRRVRRPQPAGVSRAA